VNHHPHQRSRTRSRRTLLLIATVATSALVATGLAALPASAEEIEQVTNGGFDDGSAGWYSYGTDPASVVDGRYCADVPGGLANPWDAGIGQNGTRLVAGAKYTFTFEATAAPAASVKAAVQLGSEPYTSYLGKTVGLTDQSQKFTFDFTASEDTTKGQVAFQLGGSATAYTFCVDNVSLVGGEAAPPYVPETGSRVRVNQVGYLPNGPKSATLVTETTDPLDWQLKTAAGQVVATGKSTPRGLDAASGQNVQTIDFSSYTTVGTGYTLVADGETSYPFDLGNVYEQLRSDSLQFFYIQRSGIAIDGALVGDAYARPAGHLGVAPNQGDTDVPCQPGICDYRLDVRGGWYDAGDHGKYVVNGGIATAQLLSTFERTKTAASAGGGAALGDGTLRVPERGNGVPDVLDEARWELEFLLRMQVPAGKANAGMVHHKIHDQAWTGIPLQPQDDPQPRQLHPVSTAATLNLAATAAQGARLFAGYDKAFATSSLAAARTAYDAAKANPAVYADPNDGTGGGTYADSDVSDEFYWAAAELYLTTGEAKYLADVKASKHHTADIFQPGGFGWAGVAALGRLDLATVPSGLPAPELAKIRASVVAAADEYLAVTEAEAYGLPMPGTPGNYFWGGNGNIINNVVVMATAFDLTSDAKYRAGALRGMDYIFGRNALNQSYVTGWGEKYSQNQHSRIFANQSDSSLPHPPAGSIAGGANASLDDPFAKKLLAGCAPQFCYVDDIESYATNEVAINWNSALTWAASFLADAGSGQAAVPAAAQRICRVAYRSQPAPGGFTGTVKITNTSSRPVLGWTLRFSFTGDQRVLTAKNAKVTQAGAAVTARNDWNNGWILPGGSVTYGFTGSSSGANPAPSLFTLNGSTCS
jgi:endoglucanase